MDLDKKTFEKLAELSLENSEESIFWIKHDGSFFYVNKQAYVSLGYSKKELLNLTINDIDPIVKKVGWNKFISKAKKEKKFTVDSIHITKQGLEIPIGVKANYLEIDGEQFIYALVFNNSVNLELEKQLQINKVLNDSIDNSTEAIFVLNKDGSFDYVNQTACNYLEYKKEELIKLSLKDINPSFKKAEFTKYFTSLSKGGISVEETFHKSKTGRIFPIQVTSSYFITNGKGFIRSHVIDLSKRQKEKLALKVQETKYKNVYEKTPVMLHTINSELKLTEVSDYWLKKMGYTLKEVIGRETWRFMTEKSINDFNNIHYNQFLKDGFANNIEYEFKTKKGQVLQTLVSAILIPETIVTPSYTLTVITDITDYKNALKIEQENFKNLYSKTPAMMYSVNKAGELIQVSEYLLKKLGYLEKEMLGKKSTDFITPESANYANKVGIPEMLKQGYCENVPYVFVSKSGELFDTLMSAIVLRTNEGYFKETVGVIVDITKHIKNEKLQKETAERELVLLNAIPDMMIRIDLNGVFLDFHTKDENDLYMNPAYFIGKNVYEIWPKELADFHMSFVKKAIKTKQIQVYEYQMPNQLGFINYYEARCLVNGTKKEIVTIIRDISDKKQQQEELISSNQEIEQYAYVATHDLKAPLANIQGHFEYVKESINKPDKEQKESIHWIEDSIKQAQNKIENLVKITKVRNDKSFRASKINLPEFINSVLVLFSHDIKEKNIKVNLNIANITCTTDKSKLQSIIQNIISNSIKYLDKSKKQTILEITINRKDNQLQFEIIDNGLGINLKGREDKIFEMFTRYNDQVSGAGIGMYLVKKMVEQLNGVITLKSKAGEGTKVFLILPLAKT